MDCNFVVGQKVIAIRNFNEGKYVDGIFPKVGKIYTIREICLGWSAGKEIPALRLAEIINPTGNYTIGPNGTVGRSEICFDYRAFRPLKKTDKGMNCLRGILHSPHIPIKDDGIDKKVKQKEST